MGSSAAVAERGFAVGADIDPQRWTFQPAAGGKPERASETIRLGAFESTKIALSCIADASEHDRYWSFDIT
jgi:hypothetical protein